jgi:hypothetical protein|tara:strand:- start:563 stop:790 length:228 start_codon:yes stop_codon:yes gene_type:complete
MVSSDTIFMMKLSLVRIFGSDLVLFNFVGANPQSGNVFQTIGLFSFGSTDIILLNLTREQVGEHTCASPQRYIAL